MKRLFPIFVLTCLSASLLFLDGCIVRSQPGMYVRPQPVYVQQRPVYVQQQQPVYVQQQQPVYVQQQPRTVYVQ
jgi:hypothetical protein